MANNVTNWVWENSRAENGALIVLLAIAHEAGRDGEAEMGARELAAKCRLGERTVQTAVRTLVTAAALSVSHGGGRGRRTQYQVIMENPAESAPIPPGNPAESAPFRPASSAGPASVPESNPADSAGFRPRSSRSERNPAESAGFPEAGQVANPAESAPFKARNRRSERNPADSAGLKTSDMFISTTGISEVPVKDVSAIAERADVERLCTHLADRVAGNGSKRPAITGRWRDAARLMIDRDGRTEKQVHIAIDWSQDHEFWRANILSMPKLREKYDQLRLQATRGARTANSRQADTDAMFERAMNRAAKRMETENDTRRNGHPDPVRPRALPAPGHG